MVEVIHKLQPKMFLFENVSGLLSARWTKASDRKGEFWEDVQESFRQPQESYYWNTRNGYAIKICYIKNGPPY